MRGVNVSYDRGLSYLQVISIDTSYNTYSQLTFSREWVGGQNQTPDSLGLQSS